jgi:hypothetical protein
MMPWTFSSHEQLQAEGYVWRGYGVCRTCWRRVLWYTNVDRNLVPVDPGTYMIHFATCPKITPTQAAAAALREAEASGKVINFAKRKAETRTLFDPPEPAA